MRLVKKPAQHIPSTAQKKLRCGESVSLKKIWTLPVLSLRFVLQVAIFRIGALHFNSKPEGDESRLKFHSWIWLRFLWVCTSPGAFSLTSGPFAVLPFFCWQRYQDLEVRRTA
ncbi:hypothetical protein RM553_05110 [Zunongwangia sp. F363]|uniref:Uncharacterized protein n=1 Tax=Autumnicola tepida TaxID=3075595 RepID=A0ABU3C7N8_9FLAO|nr:hypothetical protein [Zunongwangia sp. F363]MDT0642207.1 hypothetical protein [Zunongwangia sp. F363]